MSLTENQKHLIKTIAENKFDLAREYALSCLEEDKTQKNKVFCAAYKRVLEKPVNKFIELPNHLKGILCVEDVSKTFKENRYYISDREKKIFDNIIKSKKVNDKLMEMGIPYLNSTLLFGDSGTGKTTCGGNRLKSIRYQGKSREEFDNKIVIYCNIASVIGYAVSSILKIPINIAFLIMYVGIISDNFIYYFIYKKTSKIYD